MKTEKHKALELLEQFRNIAARADRAWRQTRAEMYLRIRNEADQHVEDITQKLKTGYYTEIR